jgi:hypothetical protein
MMIGLFEELDEVLEPEPDDVDDPPLELLLELDEEPHAAIATAAMIAAVVRLSALFTTLSSCALGRVNRVVATGPTVFANPVVRRRTLPPVFHDCNAKFHQTQQTTTTQS